MKRTLSTLSCFLMISMASPAMALEVGDLITPALEAISAKPTGPATGVENSRISGDFVIDSTLAVFNERIEHRKITQADVDAIVLWDHDNNDQTVEVPVTIGVTIGGRNATYADVAAGAMINSNPVTLANIFTNSGFTPEFVITGFDADPTEGNTVHTRIAVQADLDANVYTSGTTVKIGDPVFRGISGTDGIAVEYLITDSNDNLIDVTEYNIDITDADNPVVTYSINNTTNNTTGDPIPGAIIVREAVNFGDITMVNQALAEKGQWIGSRIADSDDAAYNVVILNDDGEHVTITTDMVDEPGDIIIPARLATQADVDAGAMINETAVKDGQLFSYGYANKHEVAAEKTTGNTLVAIDDVIDERLATAEDIAAGVSTGGIQVKISEIIPGAMIVTQADVAADFMIGDEVAELGAIYFPGSEATEATEATEAVYATPTDVVPGKAIAVGSRLGMTESETDTMMEEIASGISDSEKLTVLSDTEIAFNFFDDNGIDLSEIPTEDWDTILRTSFAIVPDPEAYQEFLIFTGTIDDVRTKISPDTASGAAAMVTGVNVVTNSISNHQSTIVSNSNKYGFSKYLAGTSSEETGVNSGNRSIGYTGVWSEVFANDSAMGTKDSVAGYDSNTRGITVGIDTVVSVDTTVGVALSYSNTDVSGNSIANSQTDTNQYQGTLYGVLMQDTYFVNGSVSYAKSKNETSRDTFGGQAVGSYDSDIFSFGLGVGMPIASKDLTIIPQTSLAYSSISSDSYTETGSSALNVDIDDMDLFGIKAGVSIESKLVLEDAVIIPKIRMLLDWDILREKAQSTASWVTTGATITPTVGPAPSAFGGIAGIGFDYTTDNGAYVVSLDYDMTAKSNYISHAGNIKLRMNF